MLKIDEFTCNKIINKLHAEPYNLRYKEIAAIIGVNFNTFNFRRRNPKDWKFIDFAKLYNHYQDVKINK